MTPSPSIEKITWMHGAITVFTDDTVVSESLRRYGEWARAELDYMLRFITDCAVVIDAGSYIGTHAITFAHKAHRGMVHAFEPNPKSFEILSINVRDSGLSNVTIEQVAISDKSGLLRFSRRDGDQNYGGAHLEMPAGHIESCEDGNVNAISIDSLALPRLDFIKIDTEGSEHFGIEGARATIQRDCPIIFAECNSIAAGQKTLNELHSLGYLTFGHLSKAYNPSNFKANDKNIFQLPSGRDAYEVSLIGIHPSALESAVKLDSALPEKQIKNADDLALLMLHKPQYAFEVLICANNFKSLGLPSDMLIKAKR